MPIQNFTRIVQMRDTKSNIESLDGTLEEGALSFATDTGDVGIYTGGMWIWISSGTSTSLSIYNDGTLVGEANKLSFDDNLDVTSTGTSIFVSSIQCGTYQRVGQPIPLTGLIGIAWKVPESVYASGSLSIFNDGMILIPGTDYEEQFMVSGTFLYKSVPVSGTVHMAMWGVPCETQIFLATGTGSAFALQDSDGVLLLDSDSVQLLDSEG
jgi:hypothetical protein